MRNRMVKCAHGLKIVSEVAVKTADPNGAEQPSTAAVRLLRKEFEEACAAWIAEADVTAAEADGRTIVMGAGGAKVSVADVGEP